MVITDFLNKVEVVDVYKWARDLNEDAARFAVIFRALIQTGMMRGHLIAMRFDDLKQIENGFYEVNLVWKRGQRSSILIQDKLMYQWRTERDSDKWHGPDNIFRPRHKGAFTTVTAINHLFNGNTASRNNMKENYIGKARQEGLLAYGKLITPDSLRYTTEMLLAGVTKNRECRPTTPEGAAFLDSIWGD